MFVKLTSLLFATAANCASATGDTEIMISFDFAGPPLWQVSLEVTNERTVSPLNKLVVVNVAPVWFAIVALFTFHT